MESKIKYFSDSEICRFHQPQIENMECSTPMPSYTCDFDSDDSLRDEDYFPPPESDGSIEAILPTRPKKLRSHRQPEKPALSMPTKIAFKQRKVVERRVSYTINTMSSTSPPPPQPSSSRKRRNTVEVGDHLRGDRSFETVTTMTEIEQPQRKRRKFNSSLQERKREAKNKRKLEHCIKEGCHEKCLKKCQFHFKPEDRQIINEAFWDMTWEEQHAFVKAHTSVAIPKRKITTEPKRKPRRTFSFKKPDHTRVDVCKTFFLTTLGYKKTNDRILFNIFEVLTDKRGKHQKTPLYDRDLLTQHVESFNPLEPHYRREHAPHRRYLPSDLSATKMHAHFCSIYSDKPVSYELYRLHLKSMGISFTRLGNEECEVCEAYQLHQKATSHDAKNIIPENCTNCVQWAKHHEKYVKARQLYEEHKKLPQNNLNIYFSADLEKVIMLPRLETFKSIIFCQRLIVFNQTFAPVGKITATSKPLTALWHDSIAGRKQEDIMSAFYHFVIRNRDVKTLNLWLDNCSSQNKNWLLYSLLVHLVNSDEIATEQIIIYYFEPGHTFMSSDQVHHQVELAMKRKVKLYDFTDFEESVGSINNSKVTVKSMQCGDFLNVPNYVSDRRIQKSNPRAYLKDISQVCFTRNSYDLKYKNNFDDEYILLRFLNDKYLKTPNIMKLEFRCIPKGIDAERKSNIIKNVTNIIPEHKLLFWKNLPPQSNNLVVNATTRRTKK